MLVVAIGTTLMASSLFVFRGSSGHEGIRQAILHTSGLIEQARAHAMANNTYVYLAIDSQSSDEVGLLIMESVSGLNELASVEPEEGTPVNLRDLEGVVRVVRMPVIIKDVAYLTRDELAEHISDLPTGGNGPESHAMSFSHQGQVRTFDRLVTFYPTGEVSSNGNLAWNLQFGFGSTRDENNPMPVAFHVTGISGSVDIFRN